jgi:hypothetical protein
MRYGVKDLYFRGGFMTQISISDLIAVLKEHPDYNARWEMGTPADQALSIVFGEVPVSDIESKVLETVNGSELVIDFCKDGKIFSVEIL